ncbi:MAG: hypothetical protein GF320_05705, partial [Armatimonadia bacterium]|nr:hypothetical protein [Armatimonadia bacterium]
MARRPTGQRGRRGKGDEAEATQSGGRKGSCLFMGLLAVMVVALLLLLLDQVNVLE